MVQLDKDMNLVVDDNQALTIKLDDFKASVKSSRDGGILEIRFRSVALDVYGTNYTATVVQSEGKGLVYREGQKVVMVFGAHAPIEAGMTTVLKKAISKVVKWRKGELTFAELTRSSSETQVLLGLATPISQLFAVIFKLNIYRTAPF